jgi:hypothetical protein
MGAILLMVLVVSVDDDRPIAFAAFGSVCGSHDASLRNFLRGFGMPRKNEKPRAENGEEDWKQRKKRILCLGNPRRRSKKIEE